MRPTEVGTRESVALVVASVGAFSGLGSLPLMAVVPGMAGFYLAVTAFLVSVLSLILSVTLAWKEKKTRD